MDLKGIESQKDKARERHFFQLVFAVFNHISLSSTLSCSKKLSSSSYPFSNHLVVTIVWVIPRKLQGGKKGFLWGL